MRVNSYGSTVFDAKKQFNDSKRKTKKLIIYFLITGFIFYLVRSILEINMSLFLEIFTNMLQGKKVELNLTQIVNNAKNNQVLTVLIGIFVFIGRVLLSIKDFTINVYDKTLDIIK